MSCRRIFRLLIVVCLMTGCDDRGSPIKIIVPRDHRGEFQIIESPAGPITPLRDGEYGYEIPKSGKLIVKDFRPFQQLHIETFVFDDGISVKKFDHPAHANSDEFGIFGGTYGGRPLTMRFYVGKASDAMDWAK